MKVKVLKKFTHGKEWKKGQVVEFINELAYELIEAGKVEQTNEEDALQKFLREQNTPSAEE